MVISFTHHSNVNILSTKHKYVEVNHIYKDSYLPCSRSHRTPLSGQVGVDTFQSTVHAEFQMNSHPDRGSVQTAINAIPYHSGGTNTAEAIKFLRTDSFSAAHGE